MLRRPPAGPPAGPPAAAAGPVLAGVLAAVLVGGLAACGGSASTPSTAPQSTSTGSAPADCGTPSGSKLHWPAAVPADLPIPPGIRHFDSNTDSGGVHVIRFTTPTSLRQSVLFVVDQLPKAGYQLGRGDAEAAEADAPFLHGQTRGLVRMIEVGSCRTEWLLATVTGTGAPATSPLLTPHTPSGTPSPLPFG